MFLDDEGPISGGRELWGFPKKLAKPTLRTEVDTLVGTLDYGPLRVKPFLVSRRVEKILAPLIWTALPGSTG